MVPQHHRRNVRLTFLAAAAAVLCGVAAAAEELVPYTIVDGGIPQSLTGAPGDVERGKATAVDSERGNCIICHAIPIAGVPEGAFGSVGPPLAGVASRLSEAELRLRIVDPRIENPETIMPASYKVDGLRRVDDEHAGRPILTAAEVEDIVAFLVTLTAE
jgi:sulfur-oxidizing protein SoxX